MKIYILCCHNNVIKFSFLQYYQFKYSEMYDDEYQFILLLSFLIFYRDLGLKWSYQNPI